MELYANKKQKRKAIFISLLGTIAVAVWSLFMKHDITLFYNTQGIMLEFIGFFLVLISSRKLIFKEGGHTSGHYVDPITGKPPEQIEGPPDPRFWGVGTSLIIIGLAFQLFGLVFTEVLPKDSIELVNNDLKTISSIFT